MISHRLAARALSAALLWIAGGAAAGAPSTITVGTLTLSLCNTQYTGYCGAIERPLDPSGAVAGKITVGFEYYPRRDQALASLGTILPQEGGPGYSSTGTRDFYLSVFDPLRDRRDVLITDKRGTGLSDPIDCPWLQTGSLALQAVADCGRQLGPTAWLYGTDFAAGDIVAVLDALDIGDVDFYGDSYGTFVGQILAGLYPHRLRSIILDSAYPVRPPDVWFPTDWATAWAGIDLSCSRSPSCVALGGKASSRMQQLIDDIRRQPIKGQAADGFGVPRETTVDTDTLIYLIFDAGYGASIYRDIDAAVRAWLDAKDPQPILRMVAEDETGYRSAPGDFSYGLYTAVICQDYPQLYDLNSPVAVRERQYANALERARSYRPDLFAPFTVDEGLASQLYITPLDTCLPWPAPSNGIVPGVPLPPSEHFPSVPTLVLSGDLDSVTSITDAQEVTDQFPNAVHVIIPNLPHVVAGGDLIGCTSSIVLRFVQQLVPGDTGCTKDVRAARTVPLFARLAHELTPLDPLAGDRSTDEQRRLAAAGLETTGDVIAQWYATVGSHLRGLRGGTFSYAETANGYNFKLKELRWTEDVAVSGTVVWNMKTNIVTAQVDVVAAGGQAGTLNMRWDDADFHAIATVQGQINGAVIRARGVAP
jgi:pimeloyl-ACP methyl ester carboxylesterase